METLTVLIENLKKNDPTEEDFTIYSSQLKEPEKLSQLMLGETETKEDIEGLKLSLEMIDLCRAIIANKHVKECTLRLKSPYSKNLVAICNAIHQNTSLESLNIDMEDLTSIDLDNLKTCQKNQAFIKKMFELIKTQKFTDLKFTIKKIDKYQLTELLNVIQSHQKLDILSLDLPLTSMNDECFNLLTFSIANNKFKVKQFRIGGDIGIIENENFSKLGPERFKSLVDSLSIFKCSNFNLANTSLNELNFNQFEYFFNMLKEHKFCNELSLRSNKLGEMYFNGFMIFISFLRKNKLQSINLSGNQFSRMDHLKFKLFTDALAINNNYQELFLGFPDSLDFTRREYYKGKKEEAIQCRTQLTKAITNPSLINLYLPYTSIGRWPNNEFQDLMNRFANHPSLEKLNLCAITLGRVNYYILLDALKNNHKLLEVAIDGNNESNYTNLTTEEMETVSNLFKMQKQQIYLSAILTLYNARSSKENTAKRFPLPIIEKIMSFFADDKTLVKQVFETITSKNNSNSVAQPTSVKNYLFSMFKQDKNFLHTFSNFKKKTITDVKKQLKKGAVFKEETQHHIQKQNHVQEESKISLENIEQQNNSQNNAEKCTIQ